MKKKNLSPWILAAVSGLALFFVFPNLLGIELPALAWVALVPLLLGLERSESFSRSALVASAAGFFGYPLFYHWLVYTMRTYGGMSFVVSVFVLIALVLLLSLFLAGFGALHRALRMAGVPLELAAPVCWTAMEFARAHFPFGGFPWALMGYSQSRFLALIQVSELVGPYGVSFIVVAVNACAASLLMKILEQGRPEEPIARFFRSSLLRPVAAGILLLLLPSLYGRLRIAQVDQAFAKEPEMKVGVVQGNVDQAVKWSSEFFWKTLEEHLELTRSLEKERPDLVVWPEAAITVSDFNEHLAARSPVIQFLARIQEPLLTGALSREPCRPEEDCRYRYYNSAYLLSARAEKSLGRYDKMRLVPFSEYVPLPRLFFFADAIAQGNTGATTPGRGVELFSLKGTHFGCVICYEVVFPHLVRRFVKEGARFMTTITNDAWFGKTGAPYQHHQAVVFRAVENRVFFVRSANTGISSVVDPAGRILKQTPIYEKAAFALNIKPSPLRTFYTRFGDVFAWADLVFCAGAAAAACLRKRKKKEG